LHLLFNSLGEKLETKYQGDGEEQRRSVIEKAIKKQQLKPFVGLKLQEQNRKLLS